jgi:zinc/manganese transport system substrate-binding protein
MNTNTSMTRALWQWRPRGWDIGTKGIKLCPASLALASALGIAAATLMSAETAPNLKVVASTSDLAALAVEVGGDRIVVESIVQGNQDPHFVESKPSYLLKLRHADLLIVVGLQLEGGWLTRGVHKPPLLSESGNPRIQPGAPGYLDASQYAEILEVPSQPLTPDIQPFGSPHYWLDPENGRKIARAIADKLSELSPGDASHFQGGFEAFSKRLSEAERVWDAQMQPYRGRRLVTYHRSWPNFLKHFQLVSVGEIEPRPGIPPNRSHTRKLIDVMKSENAKIILVEPYFELKTTNAIARETGAKVVIMPSSVGGEKGVTDYFKLFDYDLTLLTRALKETETADKAGR